MNTDFTIKNFRIFDQEGTVVPLRPITILTGCNNTGKSSIVKALCLLKDFCQQLKSDHENGKRLDLGSYKMDFNKRPNNLLGSFDLVLHHDTSDEITLDDAKESSDENIISFEMLVESSWLLQDLIVHLDFGTLEGDELKNGYLQAYSFRTLEGETIFKATRNGKAFMDFGIVKKSLLHFLYGQHALSKWQGEITYCEATQTIIEDDNPAGILFDKLVDSTFNNLGPTALIYMFEWQASHCYQPWKDGCVGAAPSLLENVPEDSFVIGSPTLGVYCYFPCMDALKDIKKSDIRKEIYKRIKAKKPRSKKASSVNVYMNPLDEPTSPLCQKIIDVFLDAFEESNAKTLYEFVSQKENDLFFVDNGIPSLMGTAFAYPACGLRRPILGAIFRESDLPEKANWTVIIMAMEVIERLFNGVPNKYVKFDEIGNSFHFYSENKLDDYFRNIIEDVLVNLFPGNMIYSPISVVEPRRMYSLEDNSDFSETLRAYFEAKRLWRSNKTVNLHYQFLHRNEISYQPLLFTNKWLEQLGIAHHVEIRSHAGASGATIYLYNNETDDTGLLLCDKGYGVLQLFTILLKIEIAIIKTKINDAFFPLETKGFNDYVIKIIRPYNKRHPITIALEEPECHMHPSLQSRIADMIVEANQEYGIHFIVESHSEYFIRKLQLLVSQKMISNEDVSLLYVNPTDRPSYIPVITDIGLDPDGILKNEFGYGFFDESIRLSKELFRPKANDNEEQA